MNGLKTKDLDVALAVFPGVNKADVHQYTEGTENLVFEANGVVYKFAIGDWNARNVKKEYRIMKKLAESTHLALPQPIAYGDDPVYFSYRQIDGRTPSRNEDWTLLDPAKLGFLGEVAQFLQGLHDVDAALFPEADDGGSLERHLCRNITKNMDWLSQVDDSGKVRSFADATLEQIESMPDLFSSKVLVHADFATLNIIFDPVSGHIGGIIDFTLAVITDHHWDFHKIRENFGDEAMKLIVKEYLALGGRTLCEDTLQLQERLYLSNCLSI